MLLAAGVMVLAASATNASAKSHNGFLAGGASILADCPVNTLCLYQDKDFGGLSFNLWSGVSLPNLHIFECPSCNSPKHEASSIRPC